MSSSVSPDRDVSTETAAEEAETIDLSDVSDLRGRLDESGVVDVELDDGRVVTALVDAVRRGEHTCPAEGCLRRFETEHGLNVHIGRVHPPEEGRLCQECGEPYHTPPSQDSSFCSRECYDASRTVMTACETCGRDFEHKTSRDASFCSNICRYEGRRVDHRPTDVHDLLYELYVEDDFDRETTAKRARANLGHDSEWSVEELRAEIDTARIQVELDIPDHVTAERVREVVDDAGTLFEVERALRISRERTRNVLRRLDLQDELDTDEEDVLEAARANLGLDEDGNPIDQPDSGTETDWSAYSGRGGDRR